MSDHDSFLRLISDEPASESPQENSLPEISGSSGGNGTPTEWDLANESTPVEENANIEVPAEEAENFAAENNGWAEQAIQEANTNESAQAEEDIPTNRSTRTERFEKTEITRTVNYTNAEAVAVTDEPQEAPREVSRVQTKSLRLQTAVTAGTVPFEAENKTAAFNYDEEDAGSRLVLLEGKANTKAVHLNRFPIRMGRDLTNELVLDDLNVSRFHAEIRQKDGEIVAIDLGSTNGIKVNGQVVTEQALHANDILQVGDCLMEFLPGGMLSKGAPKIAALQATVSRTAGVKKSKLIKVASIILILGAAGFLVFKNIGWFENAGSNAAKTAAVSLATSEIAEMKASLESQFQKKIGQVPQADLKKVFLERLENSKMGGLLPVGIRENLSKLPPVCFKLFLEDPKMMSDLFERGANIQALDYVLRERLNTLIETKNYVDALSLAEFLLTMSPDDQSLKRAVAALGGHQGVKATNNDGGSEAYKNLSPEEKKFYEYVDAYDRNYEELLAQKRYPQALAFSKNVRQKLGDLIRLASSFERVAQPEIEKWDRRIEQVEAKVRTAKRDEEQVSEKKNQAEKDFREIKLHLDTGDVAHARTSIEEFLKKYPDAHQAMEVIQLKQDMEQGVERSFSTIRSNVERFVKTESYENAWAELYKFLDMMPAYSPAVELKNTIDLATRPKASQFYNQARVYEYEADDLIAAEQYYKRAMEAADPRSDLAKKAGRRYAEVKRKLIH